jgi:hypothetical protein
VTGRGTRVTGSEGAGRQVEATDCRESCHA